MKIMKCDMCGHVVKGMNEQDVMDKYMKHMEKAHKEDHDKMMKMPKPDQERLMEENKKKIMDE